MYGLFEYSYDYYEWENLISVSKDRKSLEEKYKSIVKGNSDPYRLVNNEEHKNLSNRETRHYNISEVEYLK